MALSAFARRLERRQRRRPVASAQPISRSSSSNRAAIAVSRGFSSARMARKASRFSAAIASGGELLALGHGRDDDVDQPVGAVQAAPEIVVLAIGAAEEGAEAVELEPLQRRLRPALADRDRVVGRDPVDLDRVELVEPLALQQGQGGDVVIGIAEIGEDQRAPVAPWAAPSSASLSALVGLVVERRRGRASRQARRAPRPGRSSTAAKARRAGSSAPARARGRGSGRSVAWRIAQHLLLLLARRLHRLRRLGEPPRDEAQPAGAEGEVEVDAGSGSRRRARPWR